MAKREVMVENQKQANPLFSLIITESRDLDTNKYGGHPVMNMFDIW